MPAYDKKIEMLAEAVITYSGYKDPKSSLFQARNPGGLRATSMRHVRNEHGQRIFNSFIDGVQALLFDLNLKVNGSVTIDGQVCKSWAGLTDDSTLADLAVSYSLPETTGQAWARFLRAALQDDTISKDTTLNYFKDFKDTHNG
jgi:hypothetical protein